MQHTEINCLKTIVSGVIKLKGNMRITHTQKCRFGPGGPKCACCCKFSFHGRRRKMLRTERRTEKRLVKAEIIAARSEALEPLEDIEPFHGPEAFEFYFSDTSNGY